MTIDEFAEHVHDKHPEMTDCYIAVMNGEDNWMLEVEIDEGTIGGTFDTEIRSSAEGSKGHQLATSLCEQLDKALDNMGVKVHKTRQEWDDYLESETAEEAEDEK